MPEAPHYDAPSAWLARPLRTVILLLGAACAVAVLVACGPAASSTAQRPAKALSPAATATPTGPVALTVAVTQQPGTMAGKDLTLIATITVANTSPRSIGLLSHNYELPPHVFGVLVTSDSGTHLWRNTPHDSEPFDSLMDGAAIPAGTSRRWTVSLAIGATGGFQTGATYVVYVWTDWHEGAITPQDTFTGPNGTTTAQTGLILQ